jgi:hypothetical protein
MTILATKWHAYIADVVGNIAHLGDAPFALTIDDLNVIELGYDCDMPPSSVALLLRNLGHSHFAGALPRT